jgi:predicted GNAT family N-acyltransferase
LDNPDFQIVVATWKDHADVLSQVRRTVFIEEQNVPEELEWDDLDESCQHLLALDSKNNPIGAGRLCECGHIGRMAVIKDWRGKGVGGALLRKLMDMAQQTGNLKLVLNAQTSAAGFYARYGFSAKGEDFMDAGIPHLRMTRYLTE